MDLKKCSQTKCIFHSSNGNLSLMCPECAECGAEGNVINENCVNCWNCLKDAGYVRQGMPKVVEQAIMQSIQDVGKNPENGISVTMIDLSKQR